LHCVLNSFFYIINQSSLYLQCILSLIMLCTGDIFVLITYCSIVESFFIMISIAGILWLRYKRPNMKRPIKVMCFICIKLINCIFTHTNTHTHTHTHVYIYWKFFFSGTVVDTYTVCSVMRFSSYCTMLRKTIRSWYGHSHYCVWHTRIFLWYCLEKQTIVVPKN